MTPVLLDAGCIVALLDRRQSEHPVCKEIVENISDPLVTCEAVIAEACYLLRNVKNGIATVMENVQADVFRVPFRLADHAGAVRRLTDKYRQVPMSLADGCLVAMADALGTGRILTLDGDFEIYRWRSNRPFDILVPLA